MMKRIFERSALLSFVVIFFFASLLFAQQPPPTEPPPNNTFTMTTYYPAPFGAYKKLIVSDSVGIGTSSPARAKLEILGSVGGTSAIFGAGSTGISLTGDGEYVGQYWPTIGFNTYYDGSFWRSISAGYAGSIDVNQINGNMGFAILSHAASANESLISNHVIDITPSGNVGIGTTSPLSRLDVIGVASGGGIISARDSSGPDFSVIGLGIYSGNYAYLQSTRGGTGTILPLTLWAGTTRVMDLVSNGNVGIGTTGPNAPLDVFKSDSSATNNPGNPAIRVTATTGANSEFLSLGYDATLNRGYIQAAQAGVAWEDLLLNPKGGNVGIGTTSPQAKLDIRGTAGVDGIRFPDGTTQTTASAGGVWATSGNDIYNTNSGKVSIGSGRGAELDVNGDVHIGSRLMRMEVLTGSPTIDLISGDTNTGQYNGWWSIAVDGIGRVSGGSLLIYKTNDDLGAAVIIDSSKNVRIAGNVCAANVTCSSDQRLKANIVPLSGVLSKLEQIRAVSFEWNPLAESLIGRKSGQKDIGLIAQEVQKFYPELVTTIKREGREEYLNLDYSRFTAVLLEAVKELKSEVEGLKNELAELKARVK